MKSEKIYCKTICVILSMLFILSLFPSVSYAEIQNYEATTNEKNDTFLIQSEKNNEVKGEVSDNSIIKRNNRIRNYTEPDEINSTSLIVFADDGISMDKNANITQIDDSIYLLEYPDTSSARDAYAENILKSDYIEENIQFTVSSSGKNESVDINKYANKLSGGIIDKSTIALIDTGVSENSNVVQRVSVIGDLPDDDNGHGDHMLSCILEQNPNAKVISVKALDAAGNATAADIYSAIEYAVYREDVSIINLSVSALSSEGSYLIEKAVNDALVKGIIVVGAAGNNNTDAVYSVPGSIENIIVAGACDENGNKTSSSNYGSTVDYYVKAESTSQAAATLTGFISLYGVSAIDNNVNNGLIFKGENVRINSEVQSGSGNFYAADNIASGT